MISDDGTPLVKDTGLCQIVERTEFTVSLVNGPCRWQAPEVLDPPEEDDSNLLSSPYTRESDIFSFGMTFLEVFTGKSPYHYRRNDTVVIMAIIRGERPVKPSAEEIGRSGKGISDDLWALLQLCWSASPKKRPTARGVELYLTLARRMENAECQS
jgi:serine/threonine protein kinase